MSRILSIPDVHGSHEWEVVKNLPAQNYDYIVFHVDYFDCWENEWPDQGENFKNICTFVREDTDHRKLLLGNHDWSYLTGTGTGSCSGDEVTQVPLWIRPTSLLEDAYYKNQVVGHTELCL